jgi:hypothetical protein
LIADIPDKHILRSQEPIFTGHRAVMEKPFKLEHYHQVPDKISVFSFSQDEIMRIRSTLGGTTLLLFVKADCFVYRCKFKPLDCT